MAVLFFYTSIVPCCLQALLWLRRGTPASVCTAPVNLVWKASRGLWLKKSLHATSESTWWLQVPHPSPLSARCRPNSPLADLCRVFVALSGFVRTDMTAGLKDAGGARSIPLGRFGEPEEVAQAVFFLLQSPYITGHVLVVDGGLQLAM